MSTADPTQVLHILRSLYRHVYSLEEFTNRIVFREGHKAVLVQQGDTNRFKSFVKNVFVGFDKELQQVPSNHQICTFPELLAFIINNLKRKKKRNVLAHGYNLLREERDADPFKFQGEVTQSAAYLHGSDLWKKVALRLGTDITRHLLESCSVFLMVPPSCAFQLCGCPLYDRVSMTAVHSGFCLQTRTRTCRNVKSVRKKRAVNLKRKDLGVSRGKRKRETNQKDEEDMSFSGKRRRLGETQEVKETLEEGQSVSSLPLEIKTSVAKQQAETSTAPLEGGPSWRSGIFPPLPPSQCFIRTLALLYGGRGLSGFLLNRKKRGAERSRRLQGHDVVRLVFFEGLAYLNGLERKPKKLPRRFFNMVPFFSKLLRQHRQYAYRKTLQRFCPLMQSDMSQAELRSLLPQHCTPHRVYLFVRECLCAVVPSQLWGSVANHCHFLARVRGFLRSSKFDKLSIAELMWKMKVNDCDWLKISKKGRIPPSELAYRTRVLGQLLTWLLDGYVIGLVRACFYVTESMGQKNALRFYRQEVWARLQELAFRGHVSKGQMEELTPAQMASLPKSTVIARLRFIPKTESMRPITRVLGADAKTRVFQRSVRDLRDVLRACIRATPSLLGSTVWGMMDIHEVLSTLAPAQKEKPQPLYFAKVDVSGAYESLPHDKLLHVMDQALSPVREEHFTIRSYAKIWADSFEGLRKSFLRRAYLADGEVGSTNMKGFVSALQKNCKVHHALLVEQHVSTDIHGKEVLRFFNQMLTNSVVQFGEKMYRQCRGIPQGSVASSLLCCLCYGHMENVLFQGMTGGKGVLLAGVPQYGLVINPQKVAVNFPVSEMTSSCSDIRTFAPRCLFPWCGLLLDTYSLDVYKDYSSYSGLSLRHSLTLGSFHSAGEQMRRKLMLLLRLKCLAVFLDLKINSVATVYKNIYELVLLHAFRFHVCAQGLPFGQKVAKNPVNFLRMIWDMAQYTNQLLKRCNKGYKALAGILPDEAVELLFCLSFLLVLSQHRSLYKGMLPHLQKRKRSLERRLGDLPLARVRQAANPRTPTDFLTIQT
ncbi:telomerase reverse transcriptase isoform X2 [Corythoichthys intestinalis]|uniref:telomerase reverse transcriptase isoform X2 n=1 Tax=Corythoichthys intestinalis TaxID=161448 RepID=UPI0025A5D0CD|nr:telomerase reverse transcriptase isoform X2 [Corythoichthys intestinalis]